MAKKTEEKKPQTVYWIDFSQLNGRDTNTFIATEMEVLDNGFVKAVGSYKRRKATITLLIPTTSIVSIEETVAAEEKTEEEPAVGKV